MEVFLSDFLEPNYDQVFWLTLVYFLVNRPLSYRDKYQSRVVQITVTILSLVLVTYESQPCCWLKQRVAKTKTGARKPD